MSLLCSIRFTKRSKEEGCHLCLPSAVSIKLSVPSDGDFDLDKNKQMSWERIFTHSAGFRVWLLHLEPLHCQLIVNGSNPYNRICSCLIKSTWFLNMSNISLVVPNEHRSYLFVLLCPCEWTWRHIASFDSISPHTSHHLCGCVQHHLIYSFDHYQ